MKKYLGKLFIALIVVSFCVFPATGSANVKAQGGFPPTLEPILSEDGLTLYNGVAPLIVIADPDQSMQGIQSPAEPELVAALAEPQAAAASFSIHYAAAGEKDPWDAECDTFPAAAKTAFNAAAAIWSAKLQSSVPITISACWSDLGSSSILGYSGGAISYRNFSGAPKSNTWYESSLANALHGSDLGPSSYDDYITYNSGFTWYYGTDGHPPAGQYDLVTVAAHEIAHGLNFSGTASYSGGYGYWGSSESPNIYDTFMESPAGTKITSYTSGTTTLGTRLTSNDLWFNGTNARAANTAHDGARLKMYAPSSWSGGSSYSHLDYSTFAGTSNSMMVYAVSSASSQHNPGAVTLGLLKDLGWKLVSSTTTVPTPQSPSGTTSDTTPTFKWTKVSGATKYQFDLYKGTTLKYSKTVTSSACSSSTCSSTPTTTLAYANDYKWKVRAYVSGAWKSYSSYKTFKITNIPSPQSPSGTITDTTPTFKWTRISGATQYQFAVYKSSTLKYSKTVASGSCGSSSTTCSNTPTTALSAGSYTWKVRAYVGGAWRSYSSSKSFSISTPSTKPKAGFWASATGDEFYVTPAQTSVDDFAIYISVSTCGSYKITHTVAVPISSKKFSFTGAFYGSGTFNTTTSASGQDGLSSFYIAGCGTVSGGPWSYTATWKDSSQPSMQPGVRVIPDLLMKLGTPDLVLPNSYHIVEIVTP